MCGIAGVLTFDERDGAPAVRAVDAMLAALRHRGPDGEGRWHAPTRSGQTVALGHARLAIIDLTDAGRQPMTRGGLSVTLNGEIYNYRALRDALRRDGMTFSTESDTEVLLAACERWGAAAVDRLDGMFACGVWDSAEDRLVLLRDRMGVKPLYYYQAPRHFVFASEVRALVASGLVGATLDPASLWHYLGYQTAPTPSTLLEGVRMLEPGHVMEVRGDGGTTSRRYWSLLQPGCDRAAAVSASEAQSNVGRLLQEAVASHLVSDVPVGVFLSGGIDSGALVSLLSSINVRPRTFTVALSGDAADESADARRVAGAFGTDHTEIRLREADLLHMLPDVLAAVDHPSGDGVNTFVVSKAVHDHGVKVALSGLGGDEIFGGYASFRRLGRVLPAARRLSRSPAAVRHVAASLVRTAGGGRVTTEKAAAVLEGDGTLADMWPVTRQLFSERDRRRMLADRYVAAPDSANAYSPLLAEAYAEAPDAGLWARISYAEARGYMHDVLLRDTDQMSMAHGLEVRVPFLDHRLAAYVVALPDALKARGRAPKPLLVSSLPLPLPADIVNRPKRGFTLPFDAWMRGALRSYCAAQLGEQGLDARGLLKPGEATRLWTRFLARAPGVTWGRVWSLVALNAWLERRSL
jgi:asparagine synthase (glutamine-hydrolysing)